MAATRWDKAALADLEIRVANGLLTDFAGYSSLDELYRSVESLGDSSDSEVRFRVANILYRLDHERAFSFLARCLKDPDADVRNWVVQLLGSYGEKITPLLIPLLQSDPSPDVRCCAAGMLGYFGTPDALPALRYAAEHDHERDFDGDPVSSIAKHAIKQIKARYKEGGNPNRYRDVVSLAEEQQIEEQENID